MEVKFMLDEGAFAPVKAHEVDAGFDLKAPMLYDAEIYPHDSVTINTGVHLQIPVGYAGLLVSKSGLNVKLDITSTGLIDSGYTGAIIVKLYNNGRNTYTIHAGDKITQIMFLPVPFITLDETDSFELTERGDNGFGSTGR